jgi:predicted ATPase
VSVYAVGGMAGVGKTTFAAHAGHQLATRFPDGQVFLPLGIRRDEGSEFPSATAIGLSFAAALPGKG